MKVFTNSTLLAVLVGVLACQPADAQNNNQTQDRQQQDGRAQQRERDQRQSRAERRERQDRRQQETRNGQRRDDDRQQAQRRQDQRSGQQMRQQGRRGQVSGEIVKIKTVDVRGSNQQRLVALLKTNRGKRVPVDLGNPNRRDSIRPDIGDYISVRGRLARIGDRTIIVGEEMRDGGRRITRINQRDLREANRNRNQSGQESRGGLGVSLAADDSVDGVRVNNVMRNSPADRAGIQQGDVIVSINNRDISSPRELYRAVVQKQPGQEVNLTIRRDGRRLQVTPELTNRRDALNVQQRNRSDQR